MKKLHLKGTYETGEGSLTFTLDKEGLEAEKVWMQIHKLMTDLKYLKKISDEREIERKMDELLKLAKSMKGE
ncbi:hypothetical protein DRP04_11050 [Archaeoglobales archaeon]|nr:MAG: hypothetical protein DRP04_11050 [Archaeoglobales archaeon]